MRNLRNLEWFVDLSARDGASDRQIFSDITDPCQEKGTGSLVEFIRNEEMLPISLLLNGSR